MLESCQICSVGCSFFSMYVDSLDCLPTGTVGDAEHKAVVAFGSVCGYTSEPVRYGKRQVRSTFPYAGTYSNSSNVCLRYLHFLYWYK